MIPDPSSKTNSGEPEADTLVREIELELLDKRVEWKRTGERYRAFRSMSFVFLFLLIAGIVAGAFFVFSRVNEQRANPGRQGPAVSRSP